MAITEQVGGFILFLFFGLFPPTPAIQLIQLTDYIDVA
jgi:hypothetical protein